MRAVLVTGSEAETLRPGEAQRGGLDTMVAGRPVLDHLAMHLAGFGVDEMVLSGPHAPQDRDGDTVCGVWLRLGEAPGWEAGDEIGAGSLRVHPAPVLCDLSELITAQRPARLLHDGAPTGFQIGTGTGPAARAEGWATDLRRPDAGRLHRPAAFLDRDGVINVDHGYVFRCEHLAFTPTAVEGIRALNRAGYRVIVVTNQSGVARGLYTCRDVETFHAHLQIELMVRGAHIDAFYYAPYHPEGTVAPYALDHVDRKPGSGMLLRALRDWSVRREGSFMIGDKQSDLAAAAGAGLPARLITADTGDLLATVRPFL